MSTDKFKIKTIKIEDSVDRLIFVSDIHSHIDSLVVVNSLISKFDVHFKLGCNGDIFHAGPQPIEALNWVMQNAGELCILGNHDEAVLENPSESDPIYLDTGVSKLLDEKQKSYLEALPSEINIEWKGKRIKMIHGHRDYEDKAGSPFFTPTQAAERFAHADFDMVILGHSHLPSVRNHNGSLVVNCGSVSFNWHKKLSKDNKTPITKNDPNAREPNVGNKVSFLTLTEKDRNLIPEHIYFNYDFQPSFDKMKQLGFPDIERLERWYSEGII